jgi:hypothetical protein
MMPKHAIYLDSMNTQGNSAPPKYYISILKGLTNNLQSLFVLVFILINDTM